MSLQRIHLRNFKRFDTYTVHARAANILVGPNNSGKSSTLDAIRILAACIRYSRKKTPQNFPLADSDVVTGYKVPESWMPVPIANITKDYSADDAVIDFVASAGGKLRVRLNPQRETLFYTLSEGRRPTTPRAFFDKFPTEIVIVPQLSPFEESEPYLTDETVQRNRITRLSSRNFRNIWLRASDKEIEEFQELVKATWPGVEIGRAEVVDRKLVQLFFSEDRRDREIYWSGFGFQVWLQFLTHIMRAGKDAILVVDEPDVYLHPDLQRRFLALISERVRQYFIATHSTEIINAAEIGDIATINNAHRSAKRVTSEEDYSALFAYIGSIENVELSRLGRVRRVIFFEGDDKRLLQRFARKCGVAAWAADADTLVIGAGGFGQWRRIADTAWTFKEVLQIDPKILAIFDSDYRCESEMKEVLTHLEESGVRAKAWVRKEIENYAIELGPLERLINKKMRAKGDTTQLSSTDVLDLLHTVTERHRTYVLAQVVGQRTDFERKLSSGRSSASTIIQRLTEEFDHRWPDLTYRLHVCSGKQLVAELSKELQERYGISISVNMLVDEMKEGEIAMEMRELLGHVETFCAAE